MSGITLELLEGRRVLSAEDVEEVRHCTLGPPYCLARVASTYGYECTRTIREDGLHDGLHVADGGFDGSGYDVIYAVWHDRDGSLEDDLGGVVDGDMP